MKTIKRSRSMLSLSPAILALTGIFMGPMAFAHEVDASTNLGSNSIAYEHVMWDGIPIGFTVPVGEERILKFPAGVELKNTDPTLTTDKVSILNNNGFLYIKAKTAFQPVRVPVVMTETGEVILIDLSASANTPDAPVEVVLPGAIDKTGSDQQKNVQSVNYVTMTRFAIQSLYAPQRLIDHNDAIIRTPMYTAKSVNLFADASVMAMPLASWRSGDLYVTAVLLKNVDAKAHELDPRNLNGHWLAASFYPTDKVSVNGSEHDRTTLFLISNQPFNSALKSVGGYL